LSIDIFGLQCKKSLGERVQAHVQWYVNAGDLPKFDERLIEAYEIFFVAESIIWTEAIAGAIVGKIFGRLVSKNISKVDPNKLKHIFGQSKHNLDSLVKHFGSQKKAFNALQAATEKNIRSQGIKGVFEATVKVGTETITVRGNVVEGIVKIGTAFKP